ncbi:MAG TPA: Fur family transcriptional regulator, partial [Nocardioidaceae bacterium]|nr:Fur family transcriptional regulator [Nocardioidaceae bacterium]
MPTQTDCERLLREAGLRVTRPRVSVLSAVHAHPHADTDTIIRAVRQGSGVVSHQAVYDVLKALTDARLLRRIQPAGLVARYEARVGDNHHHVVCRGCGAIEDIEVSLDLAGARRSASRAGFAADHAEVVVSGLCRKC